MAVMMIAIFFTIISFLKPPAKIVLFFQYQCKCITLAVAVINIITYTTGGRVLLRRP
jgi:hypothetical protein